MVIVIVITNSNNSK